MGGIGRSKRKAVTVPVIKYATGQEALAERLVPRFEDLLMGGFSSPMAQIMSTIVGEAGMREAAQERRRIAETRGMSTPARQRAVAGVGEGAVSTMARVPQEMWGKAAEFLGKYAMQAPAVGHASRGRERSASDSVCCYIFCAASPTDELLEYVRRYKDSHYEIDSTVAQGYKRLALFLVPLMRKSPIIKWIVKWMMVHPMELYAKAYYQEKTLLKLTLYPLTRVWVGLYALIGKIHGLSEWHKYWELKKFLDD